MDVRLLNVLLPVFSNRQMDATTRHPEADAINRQEVVC